MPHGRNAQVGRVYCLLDILGLNPHGKTVSELMSALSDRGYRASKRTVYRDLELLAEAGFPLMQEEQSDEGATRWVLEKNAKITQHLVLDYKELLGLFIAQSCLEPLKETPFYHDIQRAFEKITAKLNDKAHDLITELGASMAFDPSPKWGLGLQSDILDTVQAACAEGHWIEATYQGRSDDKPKLRKLGPQFLYFAKGSLYLVARDAKDNIVKLFSLPRMKSAAMLSEAYEDEQVSPEDFFSHSFGVFRGLTPEKVVIECDADIASYVKERSWHSSQRNIQLNNGKVRIEFDVGVTPDLVQWVLGFGAQMKVIEPASLKEQVQRAARELLELYKKEAA